MLYGTPPRYEHRASARGGLVLFVRGVDGATGQHRPAPRTGRRQRRRAPREPERTARLLVRGLAALILLGLVAMTTFVVFGGENRPDAEASTDDGYAAGLLADRTVDAAPLSIDEVFPDDREVQPPGARPYRIAFTHTDADCRTATTGSLGTLLVEHGCSQVVRAGTTAPYDGYEVTAGLFNLADAAGADEVDGLLRQLVETGDGGFATLPAARAGLPTSQVGWHTRGHYLLYCVIIRTDGKLVTSDDPVAERITGDLVDSYLGTTVLGKRAAKA